MHRWPLNYLRDQGGLHLQSPLSMPSTCRYDVELRKAPTPATAPPADRDHLMGRPTRRRSRGPGAGGAAG